ncbi:flagellar hook-associated protein FlgK [Dechloromonas denitrificans]|uniref:flagellar hook-associated protein FlgK n=1 Tax=Dechloromonas denitrificans TaxID=281362 RepID=UPI001CFBDE4C|nr:flagellar hook-associated protein FlgK [Dechloromonas denitrificans]UCV08876.1 flagellar hook-associated protein FlgK [Dechloromonas denitrificans]
MSSGIFSIGVSGIAAAQMALLATEHNVVNASTPGYSRQTTVQATNVAVNTGAGAIGQGVHVQTVKRMYDSYLTQQVNSAQTQVSELDTYYSQIKQIDDMLADPNAGLSPALQSFFSGVQSVASNPSLISARQSMISSAQTLAERFHSLDTRLVDLSEQVNDRIVGAVAEVNVYAAQIADVNQRIIISESAYGQPANDLLDQRDQLVAELNKLVKVTTSTNSNGSYNVYIGTGQQLVVGTQITEMAAMPSSADPSKVVVGLKTAGGTQELPESLINGGELGGLIAFRSDSLQPVANELGRVAASLALTFNAQNSLGQDLLGNIAGNTGFVGDLFKIPTPTILPSTKNIGSGVLSATLEAPTAPTPPNYSGNFSTNLTNSNYQVKFGAAGTYTITRMTDNQPVVLTATPPATPGVGPGTVSFDGVSLNISAVGTNGDSFVIKPTAEVGRNIEIDSRVVADPRLVAAAAPVTVTQVTTNTGAMTVSQGVVGVGYDVSGLPVTLTAATATAPATGKALVGIAGAWTAVYSNGTTASGTGGEINLANGTATLSKLSFSGMSFDINGSPAIGDQFSVQTNKNPVTGVVGVQDGRNAVLFAKLQTQNTVAGGTATFQSAYSRLVADNGIRTREAKIQLDAQGAVLDQAQTTRDGLSGVNLDEEAANMLKFQQAYMASSKILEIGSKLFDTILALG